MASSDTGLQEHIEDIQIGLNIPDIGGSLSALYMKVLESNIVILLFSTDFESVY